MNILFVVPSYKPAFCYGGTTVVVSELAEMMAELGHSVSVYTTTANGSSELDVTPNVAVNVNGVEVYYFDRVTGDHTHISLYLWKKLWETCKQFDIIHLHSWWSLLMIGAAFICKLRKTPYILSPHGMLSNYSFKNQHGLVKKALHYFLGKQLLEYGVFHATTPLEMKECLDFNNRWKGFLSYNLVALPIKKGVREESSVFTLGFLSRIDPKKGLDMLLRALADVNFNYRLRIAGSGDSKYIETLKILVNNLHIADKVEWCGWMQAESKFRFLESVDLFVLSSHNENFAITVTEALSIGTPVLISENVGLADYVREKRFGWVCLPEVRSIRNELININKSRKAIRQIRAIAPDVIKSDFDRESLANNYIKNYQIVLNDRIN